MFNLGELEGALVHSNVAAFDDNIFKWKAASRKPECGNEHHLGENVVSYL